MVFYLVLLNSVSFYTHQLFQAFHTVLKFIGCQLTPHSQRMIFTSLRGERELPLRRGLFHSTFLVQTTLSYSFPHSDLFFHLVLPISPCVPSIQSPAVLALSASSLFT